MEDQIGVANAYATNMKLVVDNFADLSHERARRSGSLQDKLNDQYLRMVEDQHQLTMRMAGNHATFDNLIFAGEIDTTAQGAMANNLTNQMRSVAFEAVQSALAQAAQTSPPAQGTTGVAQGGMQLGGGVATTAIMAQIAKLAEAVNVLYIKVLGEEVTAEQPA
jgi:hypothetical protein